jgi:hypothetical protein
MADDSEKDWKKVWNARSSALASVLGKPEDMVLHAIMAFQLGGAADVMRFPAFVPGQTYVTAELTGADCGQKPTTIGSYELMVCTKCELKKAASLISTLARYTCEAELEPGETMDIGNFFGYGTIRALLFTHPAENPLTFEFLGQKYGLLLCIGITAEELAFGRSKGTEKLLQCLKMNNIFPYTIPDRASVRLS